MQRLVIDGFCKNGQRRIHGSNGFQERIHMTDHDEDGERGHTGAGETDNGHTIGMQETQAEKKDIGGEGPGQFTDSGGAIWGDIHDKPIFAEELGENAGGAHIIVDQEQTRGFCGIGIEHSKRAKPSIAMPSEKALFWSGREGSSGLAEAQGVRAGCSDCALVYVGGRTPSSFIVCGPWRR